LSTSQAPSSIE